MWAVVAVDDDLILTGNNAFFFFFGVVLLVLPIFVITASADKTIRLWKNGKLSHVYQGHTDAVRGLALVPGVGFVSCSNDG